MPSVRSWIASWIARACCACLAAACGEPASAPAAPAPAPAAAPAPPPVPVQADLHLDTPTQVVDKAVGLDSDALEASLPRLRAGGTDLAVMALWPKREADPWGRTLALLEAMERDLAARADAALVRSPAEARAAAAAGKIGVLYGLEGAHGLGAGEWRSNLAQLHERGLAVLGITWSNSNRFAGSSGDGGGGLTDEGRALVAESQELGILLDLSHASRQATLDVCQGSPVPVIASHSNAAAVLPHARNLTDEEIRCIAATGGVIGLNFHAPFVGGGADKLAAHADHIAAVGGKAAVGVGSDYDGNIEVPPGLPHAGTVGALWDALRERGWTEEEIEGVKGENFMRAWEKAMKR